MRIGVTNGAGACQNFACLTDMPIIVASKAAGPIAVTDVVRISRPVYLHGGKDIPVVNGKDAVGGLIDLSLLTFENIGIMFGVIFLDKLAYFVTYVALSIVVLDQSIQRKLLDPGEFRRDIPSRHHLIDSSLRRKKNVRRPVVTVHAIHKVNGEFFQFVIRKVNGFIPKDDFRPVIEYDLDPWNFLESRIGRLEIDFFADGHVPVNARIFPEIRISASRSHQKADLLRCVLLVVSKIGILHQLGSIKLLGPMALFAGLPGRAQVFNRYGNGP